MSAKNIAHIGVACASARRSHTRHTLFHMSEEYLAVGQRDILEVAR